MKESTTALINNIRLNANFALRRLGMPSFQIHQVCLSKEKLSYIPIPKNACTSILHALYEIEFDEQYNHEDYTRWGYRDIHDYYQKRPHSFTGQKQLSRSSNIIFAIVRDPVKRLISCYRNRVVDLKDLQKTKRALQKRELPLEPDLNTFVLRLEEYRQANKIIEHHSRPQEQFLDGSLAYIDRVFPIKKLDELKQMLKLYKPNLQMRSAKSGGTSYSLNDLSKPALEKAISFYRKDYKLLNEIYRPKTLREEYQELQ